MKSYLLRSVTEDLWKKVKARSLHEGHSIRFVLVKLLEHYVAKGLP